MLAVTAACFGLACSATDPTSGPVANPAIIVRASRERSEGKRECAGAFIRRFIRRS